MESHDEERLCYGVGEDASSITWGVIGLGDDWNNDKKMTADGPFFVAKNVKVESGDRFKIRKAGEWNDCQYSQKCQQERNNASFHDGKPFFLLISYRVISLF